MSADEAGRKPANRRSLCFSLPKHGQEQTDRKLFSSSNELGHSRIFEHCALMPDPVTELLKLGFALHKQGAIFGAKTSGSTFPFKQADPPLFLQIEYLLKTWIQ
jgi:hypothetical protein